MKAVLSLLLLGVVVVAGQSSSLSALSSLSSALGSLSASASGDSLGGAIPATRLESESGSGSSVLGSSSGSGCADANPCNNPISFAPNNNNGNGAPGVNVDDAMRPVDDWIKDFKRRTVGDGNDLYQAAKATVRPLLSKLKRNMARAQERLVESNRAILRHVEESTINHVYALLKVDRTKMAAEEQAEQRANAVLQAKQAERDARENVNDKLGVNSEQAAALDSVLKSAGMVPSSSVMSKIASLISSESSAASAAVSSALKKAMSESSGKSASGSGSSSGSHSA